MIFKIYGLCLLASLVQGSENFCKGAGVFPHPTDCTSFFTCHGSDSSELQMTTHYCPQGQAFSDTEFRCVPLDEMTECAQQVYFKYDPYASNPACEGQAVHCRNCSHLVFCQLENGEYQNPQYENCAYNGSNKPFCNQATKSCSAQLPTGCDKPGFICTSAGLYPDPTSCDLYHVCYNSSSYDSFRCADPSKPQYLSQEFQCGDPTVNNTECSSVVCDGLLGLTAYPGDPRYYVLCMNGGKNEIYSCPGNTEFVDNSCQFQCHETGLFPVVGNCTAFHRCSGSAEDPEGFLQVTENCPTPLAFNPISLACDSKTNVKC